MMIWKWFWTTVATAALTLSAAGSVAAENYVSWAGGFYVTMPDGWGQVDYQTVDLFLISNQAGGSVLDYDVVLAPTASAPFFSGNYVIITVDTVGELSPSQVDSVLGVLSTTFGKDVKYYPVADFLSDMKSNAPVYDRGQKIATAVSDIVLHGEVTKKMMHMTKLYEKGLATFYFYSPDSLFEQSKGVFSDMVRSFSTADIEAAAGQQKVRVADIEPEEAPEGTSEKSNMSVVTYGASAVMILIIIIAAAKKKRRRKK